MNPEQVQGVLQNAIDHLLAERVPAGHWEGELSTSALSTATAVLALHVVDPQVHVDRIEAGLTWLVENQNRDGGWGDTTKSFSNLSTTLLCRAALNRWRRTALRGELPPANETLLKRCEQCLSRSGTWVNDRVGEPSQEAMVEAVKDRYGKDRTFSVPILMACALGHLLGDDDTEAWRKVLPLPFELSVLPQSWFAALRLPVVSYALPALIAIGYARFHHAPPARPVAALRRWAWVRASRRLTRIQPENGGFLEATPLTSFVTMALASSGQHDHPVVAAGIDFLIASARPDGSWPIDTNLSTWVSTLAVKALVPAGGKAGRIFDSADQLRRWLIGQQYREIHPYTGAAPGGWAWTDLPGGVPDADDTPGALLALRRLATPESFSECRDAATRGFEWLFELQNRDGGIPTFCRGWGALPFDRSSADLSAHVIRACHVWGEDLPPQTRARTRWMEHRAQHYLKRTQRADGSWLPLWFGNQHCNDEANPTYGTACVARALVGHDPHGLLPAALDWLLRCQQSDGGWGCGPDTPSTIEESALVLDALARAAMLPLDNLPDLSTALERGFAWLSEATDEGRDFPSTPIGFYFAKLWYFERLYPQVWSVAALRSLDAWLRVRSSRPDPSAGSASS